MRKMLTKVVDNLTPNLCIVIAAYMAMAGNPRFGWFLIMGALFALCRGIASARGVGDRVERSVTYYPPGGRK